MGEDVETALKNMVRVGTVTSVDRDKRTARVKFQDTGYESGALYVLANRPYLPDYDGPQETQEKEGGSGAGAYEAHKHELKIKPWLPRVNAVVLTLYVPIKDGDGYILGEIGAQGKLEQMGDQ